MSLPKMQVRNSMLHYLFAGFVAILALRFASSSYISPSKIALDESCQTQSQPNPIASLYPNNATGTLNGTVSVIPISLELAREIIPPQYRILEHAYRHLLPDLPEGMYPAVLQAVHDHDVQASGFMVPDFSRAGIEFPFLDLLGDNTTSFKWVPTLLMTAGNEIAVKGALDYGTNVFESLFDPPCDAYRSVPGSKDPSSTYFGAKSTDPGAACVDTLFSATNKEVFPLDFFKNVTNQVIFADGKTCDNMIRLFKTNVTVKIEPVIGTVKATIPPFTEEQEWNDIYGIRLDSAFIENNYLPCENFRGYDGVQLE